MGIRTRLAISITLLLLVLLVGTGSAVFNRLESAVVHSREQDLLIRAGLLAGQIEAMDGELAGHLSLEAGVRVTLFDDTGRFIADSADRPDTEPMAPEVDAALVYASGTDRRMIGGTEYLLVAVSGDAGVVRLAMPMAEVYRPLIAARNAALAGLAFTVLSVLLMALIAGQRIVRPLDRLAAAARRLAWGDWEVEVGTDTGDELEDVGHAFNLMIHSLRNNVTALSLERDRQQLILDHLADGVLLFDEWGLIRHANRRVRELLGEDGLAGGRAEALGRTPEVLRFVRSVREGDAPATDVVRTVYPREQVLQVHAGWIPGNQGQRLLVTLQDVTELSRLAALRQELVANLSHELKTPVGAISVLSESLVRAVSDHPDRAREFAGRIIAETERLSRMIDEMLLLSQIESDRDTLKLDPVDLVDVIARSVDEVNPLAGDREQTIAVEVPSSLAARGDAEMLTRAVSNLVHNAVKFSPPGSLITVTAGDSEERVWVQVEDRGAGISSDEVNKVFRRFYKGEPSRGTPGSGLGLAIVKHVVRAHHGDVFVSSQIGRGSTFGFWLPPVREPGSTCH